MHPLRKKPSSANAINSPPSTPTPPIVEYIKKKFTTTHPGVKALAASSSAVARSIASPSHDPTDNPSNEPGSSKETSLNTAYGAAMLAVEIAKDSFDLFPPLKAVMGALSVLIKNTEQSSGNADKIRGVEERIRSLGSILAHLVDDQDNEEKARREILRRQLAGIMAKLAPLSKQSEILKFLNSANHSKILDEAIQDLAYAVTDYQISLQRGIFETTKRITDNTAKVDKTTDKVNETTNGIDGTANKIHETTDEIGKTARKIDGTTNRIDETAERIDETTEETDETTEEIGDIADLHSLQRLAPVRDAGYQAGHHDTCLRGTRESVLDEIIQWAKDLQAKQVFWLNGLAGTGKSTIAQTFSEMVAMTGTLGATFFCSRDYLDRKELKNIFPTLAYQLACRYPAFKTHVIDAIRSNPPAAQNSLTSQFENLIVYPLSSTEISCVIVVDALDECVDDQPTSAILSVLGRHIERLPLVKFFITGRPEPHIWSGSRPPLPRPLIQVFRLQDVESSAVDGDVRLYLQEKLTAVAERRSNFDVTDPWPCDEDLAALAKKSSGHFLFASILVRFIESGHHEPNERLQLLIAPSDNTIREECTGIDPLYTQVFTLAFSGVSEAAVFANLRRVLGAVILAFNPLSREQIAKLLGINSSLITETLRHLRSVLVVPNEESKEIRVFHKSLPDFLQDRYRCPDPKFFIDPLIHHWDIALDCLELLKKLKPNPCGLPAFMMNQNAANLPEQLENKVGSATRYACGYWAMHIRSSPTTNGYAIQLIPSVTKFFEDNAVPWIEVMSLENRLESVIHSIRNLLDWLGMIDASAPELRSLAEDCLRFTMRFFRLIQQSASHVYHSALPLSPRSSTFPSRTFCEKIKIAGFDGRPDAWGVVLRTITAKSKRFTRMTAFGDRIAAVCDDRTIEIYDSTTGILRLSLKPEDRVQAIRGSPDGSVLFCAHKSPSVTAWDMQTGGVVRTFVLERNAEDVAVSWGGHYLACGSSEGSVEVWEVVNTIEGSSIWSCSPATHFCWLDPERLLAVSTRTSVRAWDVIAGTTLWTFPTRPPVYHMIYSHTLRTLVAMARLSLGNTITLIDPSTGQSTPSLVPQNLSCFTFSQTTEELVCGMETHGLQIFNVSTRRWRHIEYPDTATSVSSLPNGTITANFVGSGVQLLNLDGEYVASRQPTITAFTVHAFDQDRIIAILPPSRDRIALLELATMSELLTAPPLGTHIIPPERTAILCASLDNQMAACSFKVKETELLQLWKFHDESPKWSMVIEGLPSVGGISPSGARLATFFEVDNQTCISVWDTRNGKLEAQLRVDPIHPLDITFDSEKRFYSHDDITRVPYVVTSSLRNRAFNAVPLLKSAITNNSINRREPLPLIGGPQRGCYDVDQTREWVVRDSERICWIPPGYIGSVQPSYWWIGRSLVMVGLDGNLRKFTFQ